MPKKLFIVLFFISIVSNYFAQPSMCNGAQPFCTGITYNFPATADGSSGQSGVDYGCLGSTPNPVWYYLKVATNGQIVLNIAGANANDDIDFACWGPFTSATGDCVAGLTNNCASSFIGCTDNTTTFFGTNYPAGNLVDCSFDAQSTEVCTIPNAITGQYYMVLITNFGGNPTNIIFNQTNTSSSGAGSSDCSIVLNNSCSITSVTAVPSTCNSSSNTYSISGTVSFTNAPTSGSLAITSSCGSTQIFTAPFASPISYSFTNLSSNGLTCSVAAVFSSSTSCQKNTSYVAPSSCTVSPSSCNIISLSSIASLCNQSTNTYSVSGSVSFTNAPSTGTLLINSTCGGTQIFTAPFVSPLSYSFTGLTSNGLSCSVTAVFSSSMACQKTSSYTAPASCTLSPTSCNISNFTANPSVCNSATNTYSLLGQLSFTNAPSSGSLSITLNAGSSQIYTAPFVSPLTYSFSNLSSNGSTYSVTALFTASQSCQQTITYLAPAPCTTCVINATNNSPICEGNLLNISTTFSNASSYSWSGPNGFVAYTQNILINSAQASMNGIYMLIASSSNSSICTATTQVQVKSLPEVNYQLTLPYQQGDFSISILSDTINASLFYWATNNDTIHSKQFVYDYKDAGTFQLCYYAENSLGCSITNCETINLKSDWIFYIPNTFSPNGDNVNDVFTGVGNGINEFDLKIYNKWGGLVYTTNDISKGWNGKLNNTSSESPQDVYAWKVTIKDIYNKRHDYVGDVTLLR